MPKFIITITFFVILSALLLVYLLLYVEPRDWTLAAALSLFFIILFGVSSLFLYFANLVKERGGLVDHKSLYRRGIKYAALFSFIVIVALTLQVLRVLDLFTVVLLLFLLIATIFYLSAREE